MFLVVLSLCLASSLAAPSIGYSYSSYAPLSHSYSSVSHYAPSYAPYQSLLTPYTLKAASYPYSPAHVYSAPLSLAPHSWPVISGYHDAAGVKSQYHTQDVHGQSSYGHSEPHQSHHATQDAAGNKVGSFSYVKPDGQVHRTDYVADSAGYRVASNDLPIGPAAPAPAAPHVAYEDLALNAIHLGAHSVYKRSIYPYAAPVVTPSGHLADTPEVAAAKAAHLAEHVKRGNYHVAPYTASYPSYTPYTAPYSAHSYYSSSAPSYYSSSVPSYYSSSAPSYYSPSAYSYTPYAAATPVVTPSGYLADTPEVAAAKAAHFAEKAKVSSHYNAIPVSSHYKAIPSPHAVSYPYVTASGHVADTPEVAAAKAAHLAEHAAANARNAQAAAAHPEYEEEYPEYAPAPSTHYYAAASVVTPSGHIADTPEVAHAKAAHLAEYAAVASRHKRSVLLGHPPASTVPLGHSLVAPHAAPLSYPYAHAYAHSAVSYPHAYYAYPFLKPVTHTSIVHGPHAVSYRID